MHVRWASVAIVGVVALSVASCSGDARTLRSIDGSRWTVAIVDSGVASSARTRVRSVATWAADDRWLHEPAGSHGTRIAAVAFGVLGDGESPPERAPDLIDVRTSTPTHPPTPDSIAEGILHAVEAGADLVVVAMSTADDSAALRGAVQLAESRNVVVISSLRNELIGSRSYPADFPTVLAVSSIDDSLRRAATSPRDGDLSDLGVDVPVGPDDGAPRVSGTSIATASAASAILRCASRADSGLQILGLARASGVEDDRGTPVLRCPERNDR